MARRQFLLSAGATLSPAACSAAERAESPSFWDVYADRFILPDGRVNDTASDGLSHSEGQGTALLLAARCNDRDRFATVWQWTQANLAIRPDALLAWAWRRDQSPHVQDHNNATDGDLLVAWGLAEAGRRWEDRHYREAAKAICGSILSGLVRLTAAGPVLLPGMAGFESADGIVVNPSYALLPAYTVLDAVAPSPLWHRLAVTHLRLLAAARFGEFSLPPDWLFVPAAWRPDAAAPALSPWPKRPSRFGYDAIRIPLYLAWGGAHRAALAPFLRFWRHYETEPYVPAWIDLETGTTAACPAPAGFASITHLVEATNAPSGPRPSLDSLRTDIDYYSASLTMLSHLAALDLGV